MSFSKACCTLPPVVSDYIPTGKIEHLDDLPVYTVGSSNATKAVLVFYDVFGIHVNTQQFCDILAKNCGWKVVMPDFFRGNRITKEMMTDRSALIEWITRVGNLDIVAPDCQKVEAHLKDQGITAGTFVGFCWGAKRAVELTATMPFFVGASCIHPSMVDTVDAEKAGAPILNIPSKDEPDMTEYAAILSKKPFGDKCKIVRFDDIHHGFCAARADYKDAYNIQKANEAIKLTVDFFTECFADVN